MNENIYKNVAVELLEIFNHLDISIAHKFPKELINGLEKIKNKDYHFIYDNNKELKDQSIMKETQELFSALFLVYCCDSTLKKQLLEKCKNNNYEKISSDQIFKNNLSENNINDLPVCKNEKESFFKKIIKKIKNIFKK